MLLAVNPVVPQDPPVESAIGPFYERFDGLEPWAWTQEDGYDPTSLGTSYGDSPTPGQLNTDDTAPAGIYGKVGSVGANPVPVYDPLHKADMTSQLFSHPTTQYRIGPGAKAPGLQNTITSTEVTNYQPQPDELASIYTSI